MSSSRQSVEKITEKDKVLIEFVVKNAKECDRYEIFFRAREQVPLLANEKVTDLYSRYTNDLYKSITKKKLDQYESQNNLGGKTSQKKCRQSDRNKTEEVPKISEEDGRPRRKRSRYSTTSP